MAMDRMVVLPCQIFQGGFSSERVFEVRLPDGDYTGASPREYFWTAGLSPLPANQPSNRAVSVAGYVDARIVTDRKGGYLLSIPSGDVLEVPQELVRLHPSEVPSRTPGRS